MPTTSALGRLPFALVLALLAVATLAGVYVLVRLGYGIDSLAVLAVTGAVGALYLREYAQRPLARPRPAPATVEEADEPFEDPVEEADRVDRERGPAPPPEAALDPGAPADDGLESD